MSFDVCPYKSLVFIDLEATDLPQFRPAITELSLISVATAHFEVYAGTDELPRVLNKLTVCVNPVKRIVPQAALITGLDNFLLQNENMFDVKTAKMIQSFFDLLQQPLCMIAHNGNQFDFPLLAKNLADFKMLGEVHCVDSLPIFRQIDDDLRNFNKFLDSELADLERSQEASVSKEVPETSVSEETRCGSPDLFNDMIDDETLTQLTELAEEKFQAELSTPVNTKIQLTSPPRVPAKQRGPAIDRSTLKPRALFRPSYKLTKIYERFFGTNPPVAHRAEEDTIILLKCARFHAKDFLSHIPKHARELQSFVK